MRAATLLLLALSTAFADQTVENRELRLTVTDDGQIAIAQRATGRLWRPAAPAARPRLAVPTLPADPTIDGSGSSWPAALTVVPGSTPTFGARFRAAWTSNGCAVFVAVADVRLAMPAAPRLQWWEDDSVEVWLGGTQIGFSLSPAGTLVSLVDKPASRVKAAWQKSANGYTLEAWIPWSSLPGTAKPAAGQTLPFAIGINNADESGHRIGQIYYPLSWQHSSPETFAAAFDGAAPPPSTAPTASGPKLADGKITWKQTLNSGGKPFEATLSATLDGPAARFTLSADPTVPMGNVAWPPPLDSDLPDGRICWTPYCDGMVIPQKGDFGKGGTVGPAYDLPFVGLLDGQRGDGYLLLPETPYDSQLRLQPVGDRKVPATVWLPEMGLAGPTRAVRLEFVERGGYVAMAKRYRAIAQRQGYLVPLRERLARRPQLARLGGAPDVWGGGTEWADWAWAAGMDRCLYNYTGSKESMQALIDRGWLVSRYDNYADMFTEPDKAKWDNVRGSDGEVLLKPDGTQQLAWLTYDKKTQYLKRSSRAMLEAAKRSIPPDLDKHRYNARFLDVTTADGLLEDYRAGGKQTRTQDVASRMALFSYVNSLGLVTGGEHGRNWAVPTMDYIEGMMSGNPYFSWPAGHLRKPDEGKAGISETYRTYGIGPLYRIPLWELVFHDCSVSYWYWGDSNDYLDDLDPGITDRKDALNVLYGTPPMYWADSVGFAHTPAGRARLLQSYYATGPWHELVFGREMLNHEAVTPDRLVQRTTFAGDCEAVVNLADAPREVTVGDLKRTLPPNGFVARGPGFWLEQTDQATRLRSLGMVAADGRGKPVKVAGLQTSGRAALRIIDSERIDVAAGSDAVELDLTQILPDWSDAGRRIFPLDAAGRRLQPLANNDGVHKLRLPATTQRLEIACGSRTRDADLAVLSLNVPPDLRQGRAARFDVTLANLGQTAVHGAALTIELDGRAVANLPFDLAAGTRSRESLPLDTSVLDGRHRLAVLLKAPGDQREQVLTNNRLEQWVSVAMDRGMWPNAPLAKGSLTSAGAGRLADVEFTLPPDVSTASLRVVDAAGQGVPAQYEAGKAGGAGRLVLELPADAAAGWRFDVLAMPAPARVLAPSGAFWDAAAKTVTTPSYSCRLDDGILRNLRLAGSPDVLWTHLIYSSGETGWVEEDGVTNSFELLASGPVRTVVRVKRTLAGGKAVYTKTYAFGADSLVIETTADPSVTGMHDRLYFGHTPLALTDSLGRKAAVDGKGDDELGGGNPTWVALLRPDGGHSIVPVTPAVGFAYWDGQYWGGLGCHSDGKHSITAFGFHPGAKDDSFGPVDQKRFTQAPQIRVGF